MVQPKETLLLLWLSSALFSTEATSKTQALRAVLNHFNRTRNNVVDPVAKQRARDVIVNTFKGHGLNTWLEEFPSNNPQYPGINIVGRLPGRYTGTPDDKIVLIGAHYDSVGSTPGVDDNGSGMTSLLQALNLVMSSDKVTCSRDYSLLFVAFDLEEYQPSCASAGNCSCSGGLCGSQYFVKNLTSYLNFSGARFQGAVILETILNHNSTPNSQQLPPGSRRLIPTIYNQLEDNQFRGDFLTVIGRHQDDGRIIRNITKAFNSDDTFRLIGIKLPYSGRPSEWQHASLLRDFFRSDHYRFWNNQPSLPAILVTDSANFRGFMQKCYHQRCDDTSRVTPEMLTFLSRTTDSLVEVASEMVNERCQMKEKDCGLSVTESEGQITSPYFDSVYPNNISCAWIIRVDSEQAELRLKFTAFDLEESINCTADHVEIRDGDSATAPIIGKYCGKELPQPVNASAQSLYVSFHSDDLDAFKGFQAEWSSTPVTKSAAFRHLTGHYQRMLQLIGLLVMTSLVHVF